MRRVDRLAQRPRLAIGSCQCYPQFVPAFHRRREILCLESSRAATPLSNLLYQSCMAATNTSDWKAHPVMVAIIAGAATFAFTEAWIVPLHVQSLRNEIATNAELVGRAKALQDKVVSLEGQLKAALVRVRSLETPNLLTPGNPYPVGLGLVKLGQPITDLEKAYPGAKLKKEDRYWELEDFHSVFSSVVYYFEPKSNDMKITFIVFVRVLRKPLVFWSQDLPRRLEHPWLVQGKDSVLGRQSPRSRSSRGNSRRI
jgi:hypothetical protein